MSVDRHRPSSDSRRWAVVGALASASRLRSRSAALLAGALAIALGVAAWTSIAERWRANETGSPIVAVAVFDNENERRELDPLAAQVPDVIVARLLTIDPRRSA